MLPGYVSSLAWPERIRLSACIAQSLAAAGLHSAYTCMCDVLKEKKNRGQIREYTQRRVIRIIFSWLVRYEPQANTYTTHWYWLHIYGGTLLHIYIMSIDSGER